MSRPGRGLIALGAAALALTGCAREDALQPVTVAPRGTQELVTGTARAGDDDVVLRVCAAQHVHGHLPVSRCTAAHAGPDETVHASVAVRAHAGGRLTAVAQIQNATGPLQHSTLAVTGDLARVARGAAATRSDAGALDAPTPGAICAGQYPESPALPSGGYTPIRLTDVAAYAEAGRSTRARTTGTLLAIHGGGLIGHGPAAAAGERPQTARWRAAGWRTVSTSYRPCADALHDTLAAYDAVRARWPRQPICLTGSSIGATLALRIATLRPVACLVLRSGVYDPAGLAGQPAAPHALGSPGPRDLLIQLENALGPENVGRIAVSRAALRLRTPMLIADERADPLVPNQQSRDLAAGHPERRLLELPPGRPGDHVGFVHASTTRAAAQAYRRAEAGLRRAAGEAAARRATPIEGVR